MEGDDRRRSFSQCVIGFCEEQSEALRDQDESFYGYSSDSSESDDSSDSSDTPSDHRLLAATSAVMRRRISMTVSCHQ